MVPQVSVQALHDQGWGNRKGRLGLVLLRRSADDDPPGDVQGCRIRGSAGPSTGESAPPRAPPIRRRGLLGREGRPVPPLPLEITLHSGRSGPLRRFRRVGSKGQGEGQEIREGGEGQTQRGGLSGMESREDSYH